MINIVLSSLAMHHMTEAVILFESYTLIYKYNQTVMVYCK